jgi:hypothetical protein
MIKTTCAFHFKLELTVYSKEALPLQVEEHRSCSSYSTHQSVLHKYCHAGSHCLKHSSDGMALRLVRVHHAVVHTHPKVGQHPLVEAADYPNLEPVVKTNRVTQADTLLTPTMTNPTSSTSVRNKRSTQAELRWPR